MAYPSILSSFATPQPTDRLNSPSHSTLHQNENTAITEIETFVGTLSSVQGSLVYDIRAVASNGGGHVQTANKGGTGQTSFNKGDLLIGQSSSVLTKLGVGGDGNFLVADSSQATGVKWGVGLNPTVRVYSPSSLIGTGATSLIAMWFKPSTLSYAVIELSGGGAGAGGTTTANIGVGGAGAGGYSKKTIAAASLPLAASILIGLAGSGGPATGGAGTTGGTTYFGSIMSGAGGINSPGINNVSGGLGGTSTGGDINLPGGSGVAGISAANPTSGTGGSNPLGVGGKNGPGDFTGGNALGYGGGGGGASSTGPDEAGGIGSDGVIIITEY